MEQIWQIVLAIIASIGGAGIIILGVVKFASDMIAERLSKKYEIKMNKELESFKAGINKKHILAEPGLTRNSKFTESCLRVFFL